VRGNGGASEELGLHRTNAFKKLAASNDEKEMRKRSGGVLRRKELAISAKGDGCRFAENC